MTHVIFYKSTGPSYLLHSSKRHSSYKRLTLVNKKKTPRIPKYKPDGERVAWICSMMCLWVKPHILMTQSKKGFSLAQTERTPTLSGEVTHLNNWFFQFTRVQASCFVLQVVRLPVMTLMSGYMLSHSSTAWLSLSKASRSSFFTAAEPHRR